jgi:FkbM family methyltransferase
MDAPHPTRPTQHVVPATVPVALEAPPQMRAAVAEVLAGEYEAGFFGEALTVLDIGANVGSFALWASLRWPRSTVHAFEPHPGTFAMLERNVAAWPDVRARHAAVYPTAEDHVEFFGRYAGDGEAGVADCMARTFREIAPERTMRVPALHPRALPAADVVKLDVEGAEADILRHMDLTSVQLVVLEFQDDANRRAIRELLAARFELVYEDAFAWDDLLRDSGYQPALAGDSWGRMFFAARQPNGRLRRLAPPRANAAPVDAAPVPPGRTGRRHVVASVLERAARRLRR